MSRFFSCDDFKKWVKDQEDFPHLESMNHTDDLIGTHIQSKISTKKLSVKITPEEGDIDDLIEDFKRDGGFIKDTDGTNFLVEVDSGTFTISRQYVKEASS